MGIKKYILSSLILIAICGLYVFTFQDGSYLIEFFGVPITFKIAVWVILPMLILAIFSVFHLLYYGFKIYMTNRAIMKDYETYKRACKAAILGEEYYPQYKTEWFKLSSQMLSLAKGFEATSQTLEDKELKNTLDDILAVKNGEVVDLKSYKLSALNIFKNKNLQNQLSKNPKLASDILKKGDESDEVSQKAYNTLINNGSFTEIKKQNFDLSGEDIITIIKRKIDLEDELNMNENDLCELLSNKNLSENEYLELAKMLKNEINPDIIVTIFEKLYQEDPKAGVAYLYILFELQMIDRARDILNSTEENEFEKFKILLFLKDNDKNYDTALFL